MEKTIPRKAVTSVGEAAFNEGAGRKKDNTVNERADMLDTPLPKGSMLGSSKQPLNSGGTPKHYNTSNGAVPTIPASSEMGQNR